MQLDVRNADTIVVLEAGPVMLRELLPDHWMLTSMQKNKPTP